MKLNKKILVFSALVTGIVAIGSGGFNGAFAQGAEKQAVVINPTSNWAVTKISQGKSSDPYCTLVRQYEGGEVLTLGQNLDEEYSIAIDFQKPKFDPEDSYSLTLQPGPGQLRAYEMMPASPSAMVVRLGWDDSFLSALIDSQLLVTKIDEEEYSFAFPDFVSGEKDLSACMEALKNPDKSSADTVVASNQPSLVKEKTPEKKKEIPVAKKIDTKEDVKTKQPASIAKTQVSKAVPNNVVSNTSSKAGNMEINKLASSLSAVQADKIKLESELEKIKSEKMKIVSELASVKEQNKTLNVALKQGQQKNEEQKKKIDISAKAEMDKMNEELSRLAKQNADLTAERETLKISLAEEKKKNVSLQKAVSSNENTDETSKLKSEIEKLVIEKNSLINDLEESKAKLANKVVSNAVENSSKESLLENQAKIEELKKELEKSKSEISLKEKEIADMAQKNNEAETKENSEIQARIAKLEEENKKLVAENKKFYEDAKKARASIDEAKVELGNVTLKKVKKLEDKLEAAMADNISLSKQVDELTRMQDEVATGVSDSDWNLEKATRRYNASEKEVRRLGKLLEQQRGSCRAEAKELEGMLFDPAVASEEQRKKLSDLEMELADAKRLLAQKGIASNERVISGGDRKATALSQMPAVPVATMPRAPAEKVERVSSVGTSSISNASPRIKKSSKLVVTPEPATISRVKKTVKSVSRASSFGQAELQSIISKAGIGAGSVSSTGTNTYRWNAQNISGFAEISPKSKVGDVVQFAQNYINKQRSRCKGDFASVPGTMGAGKSTYELACIGGNTSTSSSLVFFEKDGDVVVMAHQASAEDMDSAMDARDKVASQIK